jgi:GntR family transcriptional regulator
VEEAVVSQPGDGLPLPKYYRVKESVREMIRARGLQEGQMIPPERELCERYGVSRMTARQAIMELVNEGVLYREQGKGTFVAGQKLQHETARLTSFTEDMKTRGMEVSSEVLEVAEDVAPLAAARALGVGTDEPIVRIKRVRSADEQPMALETSHLLYDLARGVLDADLTKGSLYEELRRLGVRIARAEQSYEATLVNDGEARYLGVPVGSAALLIERVTFDDGDRPFEYVKSVYRGDRYRVTTVLKP